MTMSEDHQPRWPSIVCNIIFSSSFVTRPSSAIFSTRRAMPLPVAVLLFSLVVVAHIFNSQLLLVPSANRNHEGFLTTLASLDGF
jgi:hypothetical protein